MYTCALVRTKLHKLSYHNTRKSSLINSSRYNSIVKLHGVILPHSLLLKLNYYLRGLCANLRRHITATNKVVYDI